MLIQRNPIRPVSFPIVSIDILIVEYMHTHIVYVSDANTQKPIRYMICILYESIKAHYYNRLRTNELRHLFGNDLRACGVCVRIWSRTVTVFWPSHSHRNDVHNFFFQLTWLWCHFNDLSCSVCAIFFICYLFLCCCSSDSHEKYKYTLWFRYGLHVFVLTFVLWEVNITHPFKSFFFFSPNNGA